MPTPTTEPCGLDPALLSRCAVLEGFAAGALGELCAYLVADAFEPGAVVLEEGGDDRDMFFVLAGEARITHGDLDIGAVGPGDHFGELGLVARSPRAATIKARTRLEVARLPAARFDALSDERPQLALALLRSLMGGLRARLADVTESVGVLLRERSLPRWTHVRVTVGAVTQTVPTGTLPRDVLPAAVDGRRVVAGLKDRRAVSLISPISSDCRLEPLTTAHWEGQRIYQRSLALLLLEAAQKVDPGLALRLGGSVGYGQRILITRHGKDATALAAALESAMQELAALDQPLREEWWTVDEASAHFRASGWTGATELLRTYYDPAVRLSTYGAVYALRMTPLVPSTGAMQGFQVVADEDHLLLIYGRGAARQQRTSIWPGDDHAASEARAASRHAMSMTAEHERWLGTLGVTSVGEFNRACVDGNVSQLIRVSEGFQEKRLSRIADEIRDRAPGVKVVCVAGPSSSGKTTFIRRLEVQLQVNGIHPVGLSLDDYYVHRDDTPRDEDGELDFEALEALRLDALQDHVGRLLVGERVMTSRYDFVEGRSHPEGGPQIRLRDADLLMLEGIHGLNPALLAAVPADRVFRVFICPLAQLPFDRASRMHASDLRLLRRIVRDRHGRGHEAAGSIERWPSVRRGERKHIFPFQHHADAVFDSSLIYEPSVLKVYAERYLLEVPRDHDAYTTASRLLQVLDRFVSIYPDHVPPTSLLREFIGGSSFER